MSVPTTLHCIWLGSVPPNDQYRPHRRRLLEWVQMNPNWSIWLWTDRIGREYHQLQLWCAENKIVLRSVLEDGSILWGDEYHCVIEALQEQFWATASDLLRLRILYQCGGVYVDSDVEPIPIPNFELPLGLGLALRRDHEVLRSITPHIIAAAQGHPCLQIAIWKGVENMHFLQKIEEVDYRKDDDPIKRYGGTLVLTGDLMRPALLRVEGIFSTSDFGWSPWLESMRLPFSIVHRQEAQWLNTDVLIEDNAVFFPPKLSQMVRESWSVTRLTSVLHWVAAYGPLWLVEHAAVVTDPFQDYFGHSPRGVATICKRGTDFISRIPSV